MTLKQFGYLAAGGIVGYIIFITFSSKVSFIAWGLAILCGLVGAAFAFVPVSERPLDHWLRAFFKAIFSPTVRRYATASATPPDFNHRLDSYLKVIQSQAQESAKVRALPKLMGIAQMAPATQSVVMQPSVQPITQAPIAPPPAPAIASPQVKQGIQAIEASINQTKATLSNAEAQIAKEVSTQTGFFELPKLFNFGHSDNPAQPVPTPAQPPIINPAATALGVSQPSRLGVVTPGIAMPPLPTPMELQQTVTLAKSAREIQAKIIEAEHQLNQIKAAAAVPGAIPEQFVAPFQAILQNLKVLNEQASQVSHQLALISRTPPRQSAANQQVISANQAPPAPANLTLTTQPNTLSGLVTDSQNNYLESVIVVAHDKEGLPVRALKTNKLGQFVAATPLPNGIYSLTFEKDSLVFDTYQVELDGQVAPPLNVSAKKGATA